ncbi:hypothetical protein H5410_034614 [Solanum commersonii]|uniref:Uncharacterized protein n=1 Tax=Solanum commersonii TaxID=4109 RepID=A0A9J5YVZ9_SOLCO|nr:hypothetical protein H5410_034614 [Solanum commersonii]
MLNTNICCVGVALYRSHLRSVPMIQQLDPTLRTNTITNLARQNEDAKSKLTSEVEHANHGEQNMKNDRPSTDAAVIEGMQGEITCEFAANYGNRNTRCV